MEIVASKALHTPDRTRLYTHLLAVKGGRAMSSRDLSEGMSAIFLAHLRVSVMLHSWRHMAIAWMHRFLGYTSVLEATGNGAVDSQAGHSQRVASQCYGRSNFDHPNIGRDELELYRLVSVAWHGVLCVASERLPSTARAIAALNRLLGSRNAPGTQESRNGPESEAASGTSTGGADVHHHHHHEVRVVHSKGDIGIDFPSMACSESALRGLVALGYAKFRSSHQAKAIQRILERQEDLLVVLPTGGGKTLLFLLPAVVERGRYTTVVICPFVALKKEVECRARERKISIQVYSESAPPGEADIILASVEHCLSPAFQNCLGQLHGEGRLARIVVDECHLALTSISWRPAMQDMEHVRKVPVPLLLLSATVPPPMEDPIRRFFNSQLSVIRMKTARPNMIYEVRKDPGPMDERLLAVLSITGAPTPKCIVFNRGREQTSTLAAMLRSRGLTAVHYHGLLDEKSKDAAHDSWVRGDADVMVATRAFGSGVDVGAVRLVVHMDAPYSMIDLAQESGRGGRDGLPSRHIILLPSFWRARADTPTEVSEYLSGAKCRRWVLQEYVDGCGVDCFSAGSESCDVCSSMAARVHSGRDAVDGTEPLRTGSSGRETDPPFGSGTDGDITSEPADEESPTKKLRLGDALFSESARGTQRSHAEQSIALLGLVQYLEAAKDKCILCTLGEQPSSESLHPMEECPGIRHLCFKCLGKGHGSSKCPNRVSWPNLQCWGCGLPRRLGAQLLHPQKFGLGCRSMGKDKLVPGCWHLWRNSERFAGLGLEGVGCPPDLPEDGFATWLSAPHETYRSNAMNLFITYVQTAAV